MRLNCYIVPFSTVAVWFWILSTLIRYFTMLEVLSTASIVTCMRQKDELCI